MNYKESLHTINIFYKNPCFHKIGDKDFSIPLRPAIFLDRDGLIIKDCNYISEPKDVVLEIGVKKFFREANSLKVPIIIVTNQSGISRGIFDWDSYGLITEKMMNYIGPNNSIIGIYANGLGPDALDISWRKPSPGMIINASHLFKIDLSKSILLGDRLTDMLSGARAGIKKLIHVSSGHGLIERKKIENYSDKDFDFPSLKKMNKLLFIKNLESFPYTILNDLTNH